MGDIMQRPPSRWWHVLSAVIFLGCAVGVPLYMAVLIIGQFSAGEEFFVPGTHKLNIEKPGKYVVWNVVSEFRDGRQYGYPGNLPAGMRIRIVDDGTGQEIPTQATLYSTETSGSAARSSVCSFQVVAPGPVSVVVDSTSEQRLIMVRQAMFPKVIKLFLVGGVIGFLGWILAPLISIVIEVRRYRAKKSLANNAS